MSERKAEPWHEADDKSAKKQHPKGAPVGTHSLTGDGAAVGMPTPEPGAERGKDSDKRDIAEPDPLAEPRANTGSGILGPKP
jgi:hypothetical protein